MNQISIPTKENLNEMLDSYESLDKYWSSRKLNTFQIIKLKTILILLLVLKYTYLPIRNALKGKFNLTAGLSKFSEVEFESRGTKTKESHGEHYLSKNEVKEFEEKGIHGPFKVVEKEEALRIAQYSYDLYKRKFDNRFVLEEGEKIVETLEKYGSATISFLGMYQALNYKTYWDLLCKKEITHKLASLLGDDILCWRSQFFEKKVGAGATTWHQSGTFRELSIQKLTPTTKLHPGMVQLTVWIALSDVSIENGCMRIVEGSYEDDRLEKLGNKILDNKLDYLLTQPAKKLEKIIKTLLFTHGVFQKSKLLFEFAIEEIPDLFKDVKINNLEMKAGEAIIFSSMNVHGSFPNISDNPRLAFAGRYISNDVQLYKDAEYDYYQFPNGKIKFKVENIACIQALGEDKFGFNRIADKPLNQ